MFFAVCFELAVTDNSAQAQRGKGGSKGANRTPIDATLRDGSVDGITSDIGESYVDGLEGVVAYFGGAGNIKIDPDQQNLRSIKLVFEELLAELLYTLSPCDLFFTQP